MIKKEIGCLIVIFVLCLCWAGFISGCAKAKPKVRELDPKYIECPAKLMTDMDELWICGYIMKDDELEEVIEFGLPTDHYCNVLDCYTVQCNGGVYSNLVMEENILSGILQVDNTQIEFICV